MHRILRPELRGAQRVLRLVCATPSPNTRPVVRSFSSYRRLHAESTPPSNHGKTPIEPPSANGPKSFVERIQNILSPNIATTEPSEAQKDGQSPSTGQHDPALTSPKDGKTELDADARIRQEQNNLLEGLRYGQIPPGFQLYANPEDVPKELQHLVKSLSRDDFPQLVSSDENRVLRAVSFQAYMDKVTNNWLQDAKEWRKNEDNPEAQTQFVEKELKRVEALERRPNIGMSRRRKEVHKANKRRARETSATSLVEEHIPSWLVENNISLLEDEDAHENIVPSTPEDGMGSTTSTSAALEQLQVTPTVGQQTSVSTTTENLEDAYGPHSSGPSGDNGSSGPHLQTNAQPREHVELSGGRYFVEDAQYRELLSTVRGRLQVSNDPSKASFGIDHLTINHTARDADLLLQNLLRDVCKEVSADRICLDVQDVASIMAQARSKGEGSSKSPIKLGFKIYQNIYGASNPYQEHGMSHEVENDEIDDDDDDGPQSHSIDIPVGSFVAFPGGDMSKNPFGDIKKKLFGQGGPLNQLLQPNPARLPWKVESNDDSDIYKSTINAILQAPAYRRAKRRAQAEEKSADSDAAPPQLRPIIVQVPNYRSLQQYGQTEDFLAELITCAEKRKQEGQIVMVIGTDCLGGLEVGNNPRSILQEQENKSFGASSNILLTPVFPNRDAELALLEDRKRRIRTINVRHLHTVLQSRGTLLKGLEAGFWKRDYSKDLGQDDWNALGEVYWPFLYVQRLAALVAGIQSQTPIADAVQMIAESDESKVAWARRSQPDIVKEEVEEAETAEHKRLSKIRSKATRHEKKLMSGVIEPKKIATTFADIHIPADTIEALQTLTTLSLVRPEAFRYGVLKSDRIPGLLLYGPPGTGKTLAAKAVARESGATMLEVSAADLNDMYVGEGEKNIQALFSLAKKLSPCVVFLDEADAMFSARSAQGRRVSHRELLNQFLKEWDGMSNDSGSAFIMVATNRPMDLDDAVLRRLPRRILVDLPTEQDRLEILKIHLRHESVTDDVSLSDIAKRTPFYSGSDLKNVAVAAALDAVREENKAAKKWRAENPESEGKYEYPERRLLTKKHFDKALEEISASISEDMSTLKEIKKFDEQYGDKRGRKKKGKNWGFKSPAEAEKVRDTVKVRDS